MNASLIHPHPSNPAPGCVSGDAWHADEVRIVGVKAEIDGVATYRLEVVDPGRRDTFRFRPGQFNMLYLPGVGEAAISISSDPAEHPSLDHTIKVVGNVTAELARQPVGATFGLRGPFGSAWPVEDCQGDDLIVIAGGIGLAPLRPVIYAVLRERSEFGAVTLLHGARNSAGLLYPDEYDEWINGGCDVRVTVDQGTPNWSGHVGLVTALLDDLTIAEPQRTSVFCCGPEVMMWHAARAAERRGIPTSQIWVSLERNMNCAIGLCGHCQFGPSFICKDGPVLRFDHVAPLMPIQQL